MKSLIRGISRMILLYIVVICAIACNNSFQKVGANSKQRFFAHAKTEFKSLNSTFLNVAESTLERGIKSMINSIEQRTDTRKHASNHSRFSRDHRNPSPKIKIGDSGHSQSRTGATRNRNSGHFGSRGSESKSSDSNSNLTQDTGDFISDTYQATRMGWEIANDDPQRTADRLMNDEKFQKDLCRTGDNLMNSSKRMNKHLDKASKTTKKAADSVKKALGW